MYSSEENFDAKVAASVEEIITRRPFVRLHRLGHMVNASPRILIVAGDPLARAGLAALMTDQPKSSSLGRLPDHVTSRLSWRPSARTYCCGILAWTLRQTWSTWRSCR